MNQPHGSGTERTFKDTLEKRSRYVRRTIQYWGESFIQSCIKHGQTSLFLTLSFSGN